MDLLLQWLGGGCYLLNKVFLSLCERAKLKDDVVAARRWRILSWAIYLTGLPPWIIIFVQWHNWIAAACEAAGAPSMVLGLWIALRGLEQKSPAWLTHLSLASIPLGFAVSLLDFGGITTLNQWLEIGLVAGFLIGTYQLARHRGSGYLWYVLMHVSAGWLMWIQDYPWLLLQQIASLAFILDAYMIERKNHRKEKEPAPG